MVAFLLVIGNCFCAHAQEDTALRSSAQFIQGIQYCETASVKPELQQLDISIPKGNGLFPMVMYIHGGGWQKGEKSRQEFAAPFMNDKGFIYASINYRLSPDYIHPSHILDCAAAFAYLYNHAEELRIDKGNMFVIGHSAGAHLAALLASDNRWLNQHDIPLGVIKGAICLDTSFYDLVLRQEEYPGKWTTRIIEQAFTDNRAMQLDASPAVQVAAYENAGPFLLIYVAHRADSGAMSLFFREVLSGLGIYCAVLPAEGKTHATLNREFGMRGDQPTQDVMRFLNARLVESYPDYD